MATLMGALREGELDIAFIRLPCEHSKVFNLRIIDEIQELVKYQGMMDARPGTIGVAALSQVFDLEVIVAGGTKNTANEGQSVTIAPIWSDEYAMVARKVMRPQDLLDPGVARTIHWGEDGSEVGTAFESYRDENVRSDIVRARMDTDELVMYAQAGHLLSNITT